MTLHGVIYVNRNTFLLKYIPMIIQRESNSTFTLNFAVSSKNIFTEFFRLVTRKPQMRAHFENLFI